MVARTLHTDSIKIVIAASFLPANQTNLNFLNTFQSRPANHVAATPTASATIRLPASASTSTSTTQESSSTPASTLNLLHAARAVRDVQ